MKPFERLIDAEGHARSPVEIMKEINKFGDGYNDAAKEIIVNSKILDNDGKIFIKCASRILKSFGMTRAGPFHENIDEKLRDCSNEIGADLMELNKAVLNSGLFRDKYILELNPSDRQNLFTKIWQISKKLLPFTMGKTSYGLVGASKILFSVLPEIVLPIDNNQWLHVFKTVDIGDVLHGMVLDIQKWEDITGKQLNDLDHSKRLTTLPSIYNVMAMLARPNV